MMQYLTEEASAETVNARMGPDVDPRLAVVMASLVRHLHAFAKDVRLTQAEWDLAIGSLVGAVREDRRRPMALPLRLRARAGLSAPIALAVAGV